MDHQKKNNKIKSSLDPRGFCKSATSVLSYIYIPFLNPVWMRLDCYHCLACSNTTQEVLYTFPSFSSLTVRTEKQHKNQHMNFG